MILMIPRYNKLKTLIYYEIIKINVFRENIFRKKFLLGSNFENVFWMLEQPVNNKVFSKIQFLLWEFYLEYKNFLLSFSRLDILEKFYYFSLGGQKVSFFEI